jgi:hypothetical protein
MRESDRVPRQAEELNVHGLADTLTDNMALDERTAVPANKSQAGGNGAGIEAEHHSADKPDIELEVLSKPGPSLTRWGEEALAETQRAAEAQRKKDARNTGFRMGTPE